MVPRKSKRNLSKSKSKSQRRQTKKRRSFLSGGCWLSDLFKSKNQNQYSQILRNAENGNSMNYNSKPISNTQNNQKNNGKPIANTQNNQKNQNIQKTSFEKEIQKINNNTKRTLLQHRISNTKRLEEIMKSDKPYVN